MRNIRTTTCSHLRGGYTLVELLIVLLIIGIMASTAAPRYRDSLATARVEAAAKRIVADIHLVRAQAIMKGSTEHAQIQFYPDIDAYEMANDLDPDRPGDVYWTRFADTAYPVDLISVAFADAQGSPSDQALKFDIYGCPRLGVAPNINPMTIGQIVIGSGNQQRTIVIDPVTGEASAQ